MQRGRKPKPPDLHLVEGTYNSTRHAGKTNAPRCDDPVIKPDFFKEGGKHLKAAEKLWDVYAERLWWLDSADSHHLAAYVCLAAEFQDDPKAMTAARYGQMRAYASELGVASNRSKFNGKGKEKNNGKENPHFD